MNAIVNLTLALPLSLLVIVACISGDGETGGGAAGVGGAAGSGGSAGVGGAPEPQGFEEFAWRSDTPDARTERLCPEAAAPDDAPDTTFIDCALEGATFSSAEPEGKDALVVLAYNILRGFEVDAQLDMITSGVDFPVPDVLLLSEVDRGCQRTEFRNIARDYVARRARTTRRSASTAMRSCPATRSAMSASFATRRTEAGTARLERPTQTSLGSGGVSPSPRTRRSARVWSGSMWSTSSPP